MAQDDLEVLKRAYEAYKKAELFPIAKSLKFKSKENGKTCDLRYPATTKNYVLPAGTKFPLEMVVPEGSFPGYGLYVFFTIPGFGAFSQSGLVCQDGLSLTQIQNMLMEAGFELQDAL